MSPLGGGRAGRTRDPRRRRSPAFERNAAEAARRRSPMRSSDSGGIDKRAAEIALGTAIGLTRPAAKHFEVVAPLGETGRYEGHLPSATPAASLQADMSRAQNDRARKKYVKTWAVGWPSACRRDSDRRQAVVAAITAPDANVCGWSTPAPTSADRRLEPRRPRRPSIRHSGFRSTSEHLQPGARRCWRLLCRGRRARRSDADSQR